MTMNARPRFLQRGVAAVETALLLIPLLLLLVGIAEGGYIFYQYNTIAKSTRDASRYLSTVAPGTGHAAARCLAVTGYEDCGASTPPLADGLTLDKVAICDATNCPATHSHVPATGNGTASTGTMNLVTVTVNGYRPPEVVIGYMTRIEFGPIRSTMRQAL